MPEPIAQPASTLINDTPWQAYRRPFVRDLAYVLACPNVLTQWLNLAPHHNTHAINVHSSDFWLTQYAAYQQRLHELDNTDAYQQLTRYLLKRPSPNRLGFHFEGLLSFWLEDGYARGLHPYEMLASNVQLYNGKQTTGELDLILYNHEENLTEHWELAIKFFMGSPPFDPIDWVGINANDNLQRKMTHMQTKQFRSVWVETQKQGQVQIDTRYAVIKGRFFLPMTMSDCSDFDYPTWLSPDFPLHKWCDVSDTAALATINATTLRRASYIEWFTKRDFYDERQTQIACLQDAIPRTGLYFAEDKPLVIYPRQRLSDDNL